MNPPDWSIASQNHIKMDTAFTIRRLVPLWENDTDKQIIGSDRENG
jgi:hypothetical protein